MTATLYKVGDKVKPRPDLTAEELVARGIGAPGVLEKLNSYPNGLTVMRVARVHAGPYSPQIISMQEISYYSFPSKFFVPAATHWALTHTPAPLPTKPKRKIEHL